MLVVTSCDDRVEGLVDGHGVSFGFFSCGAGGVDLAGGGLRRMRV